MHRISKQFSFCYGHRVWSQTLNPELSCEAPCACRHLHGHQGEIIVSLEAETLEAGMVTDFHHLNWFKSWVDRYLDHRMILDINDPALPALLTGMFIQTWLSAGWINEKLADEKNEFCGIRYPSVGYVLDNYKKENHDIILGLVLVNFVPTSENFARFLYEVIHYKMIEINPLLKDRVKLTSVVFCETPKSSSIYTAE